MIRTEVNQIRETGRSTMGVRLVDLDKGVELVAVDRNVEEEAEEEVAQVESKPKDAKK